MQHGAAMIPQLGPKRGWVRWETSHGQEGKIGTRWAGVCRLRNPSRRPAERKEKWTLLKSKTATRLQSFRGDRWHWGGSWVLEKREVKEAEIKRGGRLRANRRVSSAGSEFQRRHDLMRNRCRLGAQWRIAQHISKLRSVLNIASRVFFRLSVSRGEIEVKTLRRRSRWKTRNYKGRSVQSRGIPQKERLKRERHGCKS